jgi:FMN-dependent NADH-azoreductase
MEHAESYLKVIFGFWGITDVEFILADGIAMGPDHRAAAQTKALEAASSITPFKVAA